jgi:hypothetical protein
MTMPRFGAAVGQSRIGNQRLCAGAGAVASAHSCVSFAAIPLKPGGGAAQAQSRIGRTHLLAVRHGQDWSCSGARSARCRPSESVRIAVDHVDRAPAMLVKRHLRIDFLAPVRPQSLHLACCDRTRGPVGHDGEATIVGIRARSGCEPSKVAGANAYCRRNRDPYNGSEPSIGSTTVGASNPQAASTLRHCNGRSQLLE